MEFNHDYKLVCVTNRHLVKGDFYLQIKSILESRFKPDMLVLREKDLKEEEYQVVAENVMEICQGSGTKCILHYFKDVALSLGADGIHLPYTKFMDMPGTEKKQVKIKGVSVHSVTEALNAQKSGASYIMAGHIYKTACKHGLEPRGTGFLKEICTAVDIPVYAIGGINIDNARECIEAGASGVCLMSGYMNK
ncbi:MAG: thiamine phosphate synthase [Lachnospiraceae bacterium]|nr:thiamine phosphate synthase [Lachnospiraceae bacterium]